MTQGPTLLRWEDHTAQYDPDSGFVSFTPRRRRGWLQTNVPPLRVPPRYATEFRAILAEKQGEEPPMDAETHR